MHWLAINLDAAKATALAKFLEENDERAAVWNAAYPKLKHMYPIYWQESEWVWSSPPEWEVDIYHALCKALIYASSVKS